MSKAKTAPADPFEIPPEGTVIPDPPQPKRLARSPMKIGTNVIVRCVTHYYTGRIIDISPEEILLEDAAWIANTGRFNAGLVNGTLEEVEPFPGIVSVARGSLVDLTQWTHPLPRTVLPKP
jgi:hypothetical protein